MTRILITGATGNIGKQMVKQLLDKPVTLRIAMRNTDVANHLKTKGVEIFPMDFNDLDSVHRSLEGVDKAFLLTPLMAQMNEMCRNFVTAAKEAGVKMIVRTSGLGADSSNAITIGRWHREVEKTVEASGMAYTIIRPNSFMQNYINHCAHTVKTQNAFYFPHGDSKTSLIDTADVAAVAVAALTEEGHEGKSYNLTGPEAISNYQIADYLSRVVGREVKYVDIPEETARKGMLDAGMPEQLVSILMELYAINKAGYTAEVSPAVELVTGNKGTTFQQFAEVNADAFK